METLSLVVPARGSTTESRFLANALNNVDLPTFGRPIMQTFDIMFIMPYYKAYIRDKCKVLVIGQ